MPDETAPAEPKKSRFERLGPALPVGLAAIATAFAGMSSSEMSRAMFWRSTAAQDQSRATSQWALAGFKRDRALILETTVATMRASNGQVGLESQYAATAPQENRLPKQVDPLVEKLVELIQRNEPEPVLLEVAGRISHDKMDEVVQDGLRFERSLGDHWKTFRQGHELKPGGTGKDAATAWATAQADRFALDALRNRNEAQINQDISWLFEARVQVSSAESERHRRRSGNFFYAMLVGQVGATGSSLALGRQRRSALWTIAGLSGLVALGFGGYVYATM